MVPWLSLTGEVSGQAVVDVALGLEGGGGVGNEEIGDRFCAEAFDYEMVKGKGWIVWLVCPLVGVWVWVEELDVGVDEEEHFAVNSFVLVKTRCGREEELTRGVGDRIRV